MFASFPPLPKASSSFSHFSQLPLGSASFRPLTSIKSVMSEGGQWPLTILLTVVNRG